MQPFMNTSVCAGIGISIRPARMIICMALIMPQSYCIDPAIKRETMRLLVDSELTIVFALLVTPKILFWVSLSI